MEETKKPDMTKCCDFELMLYAHEDFISMCDVVGKLVDEQDKDKRTKLGQQHLCLELSYGLWQHAREKLWESKQETIDCSWRNILDKGWISPAAQGMFKKQIVAELGEEEYKKAVMKDWTGGQNPKDMGKELAVREMYNKFAEDAFAK